ncbi:PRC-barrel domain-containing protein [Phyllobacteriaceae bacterium JZ32]
MLKRLLGSAAAIAMLSTVSFAQSTDTNQMTPQAQPEPPAQTSTVFQYPPEVTPKVPADQNFSAVEGKVLASGVIGQPVYDGSGNEANRIGDINDIVIGQNGVAQAAVIGVGGFLGIGEKDVAVGFDRLQLATQADGDRWFVASGVSKEELNRAPAFERSEMYTGGIADPDKANRNKQDETMPGNTTDGTKEGNPAAPAPATPNPSAQ